VGFTPLVNKSWPIKHNNSLFKAYFVEADLPVRFNRGGKRSCDERCHIRHALSEWLSERTVLAQTHLAKCMVSRKEYNGRIYQGGGLSVGLQIGDFMLKRFSQHQ